MRILNYLCIALLPLIFITSCKDDEKRFVPSKYNKNGEECFDVQCYIRNGDTICYQHPGTPRQAKLPKSSVCYDVLKEAAPSTPPSTTIPPPDNKSSTYQISYEFIDSVHSKYGFDPALGSYEISTSLNERRSDYFSVKRGGKMQVAVKISSALKGLFSSFNIKLGSPSISFDSTFSKDSTGIFDSASLIDTINIYGRSASLFPIPIIINGVNRSGISKCLICNDSCDESINALCYDEKIIDSIRMFRINNPAFNQPDTTVRNTFNDILKQAVVKINGVGQNNFTSTYWDKNNNGKLDMFPNRDSVPSGWFEQDTLRALVEKFYNNCLSCASVNSSAQPAKVFICPSTINAVWILMDSAKTGDSSIVIQYSSQIESRIDDTRRNVNFKLQDWNGTNSEIFQINYVEAPSDLKRKNRMIVHLSMARIKNNHAKNSILVWENFCGGFAYGEISCAWVMGTIDTRTILHELLHTHNIGRLQHAKKDTINLMYPAIKTYSQLRYRQVELDNQQDILRQWDAVNE
jgi:hypothetical protein